MRVGGIKTGEPITEDEVGRRVRLRVPLRPPLQLRSIEERRPQQAILRRESQYRRLLAAADLVCAGLALALAVNVVGDGDTLRPAALLALPLVVLVAKLQGLYDRDNLLLNKTTLDEAPRLFQAATLYTLVVVLGQGTLVSGHFGSGQVLALWATLFVTGILGRWGARRLARRMTDVERVLVLGDRTEADLLDVKLRESPVKATVVGCLPLTSRLDQELDTLLAQQQVHRIVVAPGEGSYDQAVDAIRLAKGAGLPVSVLPRLLEVVGSSMVFDQVHGMSLLGVRRFGLTWSSQLLKDGLDRLVAGAGLVLFAPLLALIAVGVRVTSPGPILFRQKRIGLNGQPFELVKFRTMVPEAEELRAELEHRNEAPDGLFKIATDPRVTTFGRLLRQMSLDELPQLFNVLRGDMSLVGPRPLIPEEDGRLEGWHRRRLSLKPGMTGHWQIAGSSKIPLREMVVIDYLYAANWSLWGDIKILCRTIPYVVGRRGL